MRGIKVREMLRAVPFRPFLVKTTDGDTFKVEHPEFALVSPSNRDVVIFDRDGHFRLVATSHIVSMEPQRNGSKKPGKR